ncbi:MAG: DUF1549 domain-containing protein [Planctomycetota bacterium]
MLGGLHFVALKSMADEAVTFDREIRPIIDAKCVRCHGPEKQRSGLRLDRQTDALKGGEEFGPAIVPGKSDESSLFKMIAGRIPGKKMPREGPALTAAEIDAIRRWIDQGAKWPPDKAAKSEALDGSKNHWAFKPVARPEIPAVKNAAWVRNPIDRFILAGLDKAGLEPSTEASRAALIRRVSFDLIGLPPTPEEIDAFVLDRDPDAYAKLVDRLLASPHYGERWARHWLDVVRFAESNGFEMNQNRPNAWRYRDYVIRAFNDDKPYDQFIREQIAGDSLGAPEATGFLVAGPWDQVKSPDPVLTAQQRADELHDMIGATTSVFLGLTVGCARCHNHKFDPIPQTDYYRMKACLEGVQHGDRSIADSSSKVVEGRRREIESLRHRLDAFEPTARPIDANSTTMRPAVVAGRNVDRFEPVEAKFVRFTILASSDEPCIDELEVFTAEPMPRNVALASTGAKAKASGTFPNNSFHKLEHINDGVYGNERSWISNEKGRGWIEIEFSKPCAVDRVVWSRDREMPPKYQDRIATGYRIDVSLDAKNWKQVAGSGDQFAFRRPPLPQPSPQREALLAELRRIEASLSEEGKRVAYAGNFVQPEPTRRLHRGDATQPKEVVAPGSLTEFGSAFDLPANAPERERRLALARWIADVKHPLTARVIANRLWHYHFGLGIVSTPSDFGINGGRPSHPELLDWLASELVSPGENPAAQAWSLKRVHRLICLSATYRQDSRVIPKSNSVDAGTRLLWRYPPRRLEAEPLRDAVLAVTGQLNLKAGGPGFDLFEPNNNYVKVYTPRKMFGAEEFRRMVYQARPRMQLDDTFGAFDCPDAGQVAPRRTSSTTPLQAFNLLNSPFMLQQSDYFAERLRTEVGVDPSMQVRRAFRLTFGRLPVDEELAAAHALIRDHGLASFCRAILSANEFLYVN